MITDLRNSIIFLHGLSGSGKGEVQRQINEKYKSNGYEVIYGSSGDLLRAGFADPFIRTRLLNGYYFETLEPIVPGLERIFKDFIETWRVKDKKAILILDGVIRRTDFVNAEGRKIPPQIEQVAQCLNNVLTRLVQEDQSVLQDFPEYKIPENEDSQVRRAMETLKATTHIITDVWPQDAESQMKARASKEVLSIKRQIEELSNQGQVLEKAAIARQTQTIEEIVEGNFSQRRDTIIYDPSLTEEERSRPVTVDLNLSLNKAKNELAKIAGVEGEEITLSSIYKTFGIVTAIREDDITPLGRSNRIRNFVRQTTEGSVTTYEYGFAAIALTRDLGFSLTPDISFESVSPNCRVLENGQSKGITLEQFRQKSSTLAEQLFIQTERERLIKVEGNEGFRHGKER